MGTQEIRDYACGVLNFGGILAKRLTGGAMTGRGVSVASVQLRFVGLNDAGDKTEIVANLSREQVSDMARSLVEMICDG